MDRESRCRSHENAGHLDHIHVDHNVGGGTSKVKGRRTDELLRLHGKSDQDSPYDRRSGEQRGKEEETTSEEHRRKKPVFLLTETIAQHADKPQERNSREWHQIESKRHLARTF